MENSWIRRALMHVPHGWISVLDRNLHYRFTSGRGLVRARLKPENFIGKTPAEVFPPEIAERIELHYREVVAGCDVTFDILLNEQWYTINASPLFDECGEFEGLIAIAQNSDERKRAEAELEETNREIVTIWESMTDGFFAVDADWRFTYINAPGERILQRKRNELLGRNLWEVFPEAIDTIFDHQYHKAVAEQVAVNFETFYPQLGLWVEVHAYPSPAGLMVYFHEINERKQAEITQSYFASIVEFTDDAMIGTTLHMVITSWNAGAERMLGYTAEEAIGRPFDILVPAANLAEYRQLKSDHIASGRNISIEEPMIHKDGSVVEASIHSILVRGAEDAAIGIFVIARDITERKRAEEARMRLAAIVESSSDGMLSLTLDGTITSWNRGATQIYGYTTGEAVGRPISMLMPPDRSDEDQNFEKIGRGEYILPFETKRKRKDGQIIDVAVSRWPLLNAAGEVIGASSIARDITLQKQAAQKQEQLNLELEQQHRRMDDMLNNVPGIVWENAIDPQTSEQSVVYVSKYVETMLGYTHQEWMNTPDLWLRLLHPDDRERTLAQSMAMFESKRNSILRYRLLAKDGRAIWTETHCAIVCNERNEVIGLHGVTMDITERMQAQEEQSRLAALLESTIDLVAWADTEGNVQYINPAGRTILGLTPDEPADRYVITDFFPPATRDLIMNTGLPTASRQNSWAGETILLNREGREIPFSQVITAHKDATGKDSFYSTIARDISESKRVQALLEQSNEELEERVTERTAALEQAVQEATTARAAAEAADRAKSEFLSRMSHELRTPMNAILGFGQILEMRKLTDKEGECVQQILKAGQHLLQLINEVLEISRIEAGRLSLSIEPVEVGALLREVVDLVQPLATPRNITLLNEFDSEPDARTSSIREQYILADRHRLHQVMINLLSNAIKYNRENGTVSLSLREVVQEVEVGKHEAQAALRIEVSDTGHGIAAEHQQKIFLPFERLDAETTGTEGTGIGLTLTKRLVELMDGHIGVESQPGHGSTFWVELPVAESPSVLSERSNPEISPSGVSLLSLNHPVTILYIEDNVSNLSLMQNLLKETPQVRLVTAMQGSIGLELARQHRPDLILLDLHLPHLPGEEVLRQLLANPATSRIPVVVVSADATPHQIDRLLTAGASHYITKPIDFKNFVQVLETLLKES